MSSFTQPLILKKIGDRLWELFTPFEYHVGSFPSKDVIVVPVGFKTDLASTPRATWIVMPPDGRYAASAVVHDWGYHTQTRSRLEVDRIFLEGMTVLGVPWWKRRIMYSAVRTFGFLPWNNHAKKFKYSSQ